MPTSRYWDQMPSAIRADFTCCGFVRARPDVAETVADHRADALANSARPGRVAFGALLDHAFQHGPGKGDAAGLDRLKVVGCQEVPPARIGPCGHALGLQLAQGAEGAAGLPLHERGRVVLLQHVRHGGCCARGDVVERIVPERHDQRPLVGRPHAPDEAPGASAQTRRFQLRKLLSVCRCRGPSQRPQNAGMRRSLGYSAPTTCWIVTARTI